MVVLPPPPSPLSKFQKRVFTCAWLLVVQDSWFEDAQQLPWGFLQPGTWARSCLPKHYKLC